MDKEQERQVTRRTCRFPLRVLCGSRLCCLFAMALALLCFPGPGFGEDATGLFEQGKKLSRSGNHRAALDAFAKALERVEPDKHNAHVIRLAIAQSHMGAGDMDKAWSEISEVMQSPQADRETLATGLHLRGILSIRKKKWQRSADYFTEAIKTYHENKTLLAACFANRAVAFVNMEDLDRAASDLTKAIQLDADSGFAYAVRGLVNLRKDQVELAKRDSERALSLNPDAETERVARKVLQELSVSASGAQAVSVPMDDRGHIFVQVRFSKNGKPYRFLLDTGATETLISPALLEEISKEARVTKAGKGKVRIADGTYHDFTSYKVKTAFLYHLPLGSISVNVLDKAAGRVQNLLGVRSITGLNVSIDNARKKADIRRIDPDELESAASERR